MGRHYDHLKRQKMIAAYPIETNTRGREFLNRKLMPYFAEKFKDGDRVLSVGKHPIWDYSPLFNSPAKQVEFMVSDIQPEMDPDVVDNMGKSQFPDNHFDGIVLVGVYDSIINSTGDEISKEVHRVVKPGGHVLIAWSGTPRGIYSPHEAWPWMIVDEVHWSWGTHFMEKDKSYYSEGENQGIFIIGRNRA